MNILDNLNEQQQQAVLHINGPCMVLAGAGSGKTRVLTRRIANLIDNGVLPNSILAITFTNKAAQEMRSRVAAMIPDYAGQWIQTFHAACYKILRMDIEKIGYNKNFSIIDDTEGKTLIKGILKEENDYETKPEDILYSIKFVKNGLINAENYYKNINAPQHVKEKYYRLYRIYNARLKELNALDFEDLIGLCIRLFKEHPDVLEKYQQWFKYIMIDEYQDTNYAQYLWANLLADKNKNICIVGDPDQSIYSWRGAEPYNIKRFLKDYPETKVIKLEVNYRSTRLILEAANSVIKNNQDREEKNLYTANGQGDKIVHFCAGDSYQEAKFIADAISELIEREGKKYSDCAIFYRTHAQSRLLEDSLLYKYIPYRIIGARKFYERKEVKDIIAYLKVICNYSDLISFRRIINVPRRGVGDKTLEKIEEYAAVNEINLLDSLAYSTSIPGISKKMGDKLEDFHGMIKYFSTLADANMPLKELIDQVLDMTGYIEDLKKSKLTDIESRIENIQEIKSLAVEFEAEGGEGLEDFLAQIALVQDTDDLDHSDAVSLMTYHGAKGLEFPVVFMTGMEEGVFPSYRTETAEEMEEERRLCYVGITRAQERLYLTNTISRLLYGFERNNPPSRFLKEIPDELLRLPSERVIKKEILSEGDKVAHRKFGIGFITKITDDEIAIIDFDRAGVKMLRLDIAPLEKIS
ncbi:ATP-dependent DNA helicase UvrD/PcrA [Candidatus Syntrophocurvum alkaliphilum]|uniref:DNA 3'-5' helicase n=1 Tax=Candidatus Syntrophocurvum alkaliphilum TaxID=2293317 RepID=A0A6I6DBP7_9FIRM|nr:UvrD-helicase domain-containing protein [Candidatus Syntrophocurvum alkaliphilum]QGT98825.1 ATP-dependent DNA helicase UvrD/PcrA [Candidatus Syntrophocurvum alkaliphilum]